MLIVKFIYNNAKNLSISYMLFKLNYGYNFRILYIKNYSFYFKLKSVNKLLIKLKILIIIYYKNYYYI